MNRKIKIGGGILNSAINKIPFELHIPGYQYCGPGTNLKKRLSRGDPGINQLDQACKQHDITYSKFRDGPERYEADKLLAQKAWSRVKSGDASVGERASAIAVTAAMKTKMGLSKIGGKLRKLKPKMKKKKRKIKKSKTMMKTKKKQSFASLVRKAKIALKKSKPTTIQSAVDVAVRSVRGTKKGEFTRPRIIPIPKTGGVLPLIPIFAGLSALGALLGGTSSIVKTVNETKQAKEMLNESQRHNHMMEAVALGKQPASGAGLYLKPYKKGYGLYLKPYQSTKNF